MVFDLLLLHFCLSHLSEAQISSAVSAVQYLNRSHKLISRKADISWSHGNPIIIFIKVLRYLIPNAFTLLERWICKFVWARSTGKKYFVCQNSGNSGSREGTIGTRVGPSTTEPTGPD